MVLEASVVDSVGWDVGLLDELERLVSNEHLLHLLGESWHDRVAIAIHRESFLDGELCRLALREEEVGLGSLSFLCDVFGLFLLQSFSFLSVFGLFILFCKK